ncbi:hypothetical protein OAO34_06040, partial [Candidatus Poseidoniaceae archaeon]|nr:hypothetical protein [Candidatus Poseidoniaceae archaeon]
NIMARKCGICRQEGHDRMSCPQPEKASNNGPLVVELIWILLLVTWVAILFPLSIMPQAFIIIMFISLATRLGLIRIYAKFRPNWRETDPTGDDLSEALRKIGDQLPIPNPKQIVAQAIYDLKPEERIKQGIEELKELDEEMTEHEWYRKNRDAILFVLGAGALILLLSLSIIFILILEYFSL